MKVIVIVIISLMVCFLVCLAGCVVAEDHFAKQIAYTVDPQIFMEKVVNSIKYKDDVLKQQEDRDDNHH